MQAQQLPVMASLEDQGSFANPNISTSAPVASSTSAPIHFSHSRRRSRNPNASPLPSFSFNPGAGPEKGEQQSEEQAPPEPFVPQPSLKRANKPAPLPEFKFNPGADLPAEDAPSPTHPILEEMAQNQYRVSRSARPAPLSSFTLPPGNTALQTTPSPTKMNFHDPPTSVRSSGHRRGVSEFVGGGPEGAQLVATSPERLPIRSPGPAGGRGHTHRRSQAISVSDISSDLIKLNAVSKFRSGSTPTTPSDTRPSYLGSPQRHSVSTPAQSPPVSPRRRESAPTVRPRVGFSEHVDFIPRPLSMISSETSGSASTIRGYHSVSGSIASVAASPTPQVQHSAMAIDPESPPKRPQTADGADTPTNKARAERGILSAVTLPKRPLSAAGSPNAQSKESPPLKKKFWFSNSADNSPLATPKTESNDPFSTTQTFATVAQDVQMRPKTSPERTPSKKVKVRSWTGGIFSRKSRQRSVKTKSRRNPASPMLSRRTSDQFNDIFDSNNTVVIRDDSPMKEYPISDGPKVETGINPSTPTYTNSGGASPMIDLDAALGPFGSEEKFTKESAGRPSSRFAKLHSSGRGTTDAFGVHRRTESAPQMAPVNRSAFGMHRLESKTSVTEDVFDEEEEDNFLAEELHDGRSSALSVNSAPSTAPNAIDGHQYHRPTLETVGRSNEGLGLSSTSQADDSVLIVDSDNDIVVDAARASNSTIEAPLFTGTNASKDLLPSSLEFAYPAPQTHYTSSTEGQTATNSLISSPEPDHISFDQNLRSDRYLGERSPDFPIRASNDDLPSLTDSISTAAVPRFSSSANTRSSVEQRSASVSDPIVEKPSNAWKRASLASLNRLIPGSSNGSRLKFETLADPSDDEKARKKGNRISKLMHFWRSKEKCGK